MALVNALIQTLTKYQEDSLLETNTTSAIELASTAPSPEPVVDIDITKLAGSAL